MHPIQPYARVNFNPHHLYFRYDEGGKIERRWVTYSEEEEKIYCSICLAFGKETNQTFSFDVNDKKHLYTRVSEHEALKAHSDNTKSYLLFNSKSMVENVINETVVSKRLSDINFRRSVLNRVIDVIKLIGRQGLAFRGKRNEALHNIFDDSLNHGNFLEIIKLISKYDSILETHVAKVVTSYIPKQNYR